MNWVTCFHLNVWPPTGPQKRRTTTAPVTAQQINVQQGNFGCIKTARIKRRKSVSRRSISYSIGALYGTIRDATLTCARKPTWVRLIYRTETTTKNRKTKNGSTSKSLGNHAVRPEEEKERLQWEWFAEKEGFKPEMKEWVGDGILIIISMTVSSKHSETHHNNVSYNLRNLTLYQNDKYR